MRSVILFVLGAPGVGKTTLVRFLLGEALRESGDTVQVTQHPDPKWTIAGGTVAAGHYIGQMFDGADTVPYNGAVIALNFWRDRYLPNSTMTILDGARFSTKPSLAFLRQAAPDHALIGVHLVGEEQAAARRRSRGSNQSASWVKGATTGAKNFASEIGAPTIDASQSALAIAGEVTAFIQKSRAA